MKKGTKSAQPNRIKSLSLTVLLIGGGILYSTNASAGECAGSSWVQGEEYKVGNVVRYRDHNYQVLQSHVALVDAGWTPPNYPILWKDLGGCSAAVAAAKQTSEQASSAPVEQGASSSGNANAGISGAGGSRGGSSGGGSFSARSPSVQVAAQTQTSPQAVTTKPVSSVPPVSSITPTPIPTPTLVPMPISAPLPTPIRVFRVSSIPELQAKINSALPGDEINVVNGTYTVTKDITVTVKATAAHPIVIKAETVGGAEIKGSSGFNLNSPASYVVIHGFKFTHAAGGAVVRPGATHNRITRNVFELTGTGVYLFSAGDDTEIDHNEFRNKQTLGQMLTVQGPGNEGMAQRTWVHHNYFHDFKSPGGNGAETIRVGLSGRSLSDAFSLFEFNLFERTNGENEMISNKSSFNTYRYNTMRDTTGDLTLRHGNKCVVHSNFFLKSAGLRIFGDDHKIFSNYFESCDPSITIGNGDGNVPPVGDADLKSHDRPDRITISFNTVINSRRVAELAGRTNGLGATFVVISNNILQTDTGNMFNQGGPMPNSTFEGNIVFGSAPNGAMPANGARRIDPQLARDSFGVFRLSPTSPAIDAGVGSYPEVIVDMEGQPRIGAKDVGADEISIARIKVRPLTPADVGPNSL